MTRCPATCAAAPATGRSSTRRDAMYDLPAPADWRGPGRCRRRHAPHHPRRRDDGDVARRARPRRDVRIRRTAARRFLRADHDRRTGARWWPPIRRRAFSRAAPTSACGSPSSTAISPDLIHVGAVRELAAMRETDDALEIGAAVTLADAFAALDAEWPELAEAWQRFALGADPQCRHARRQRRQRLADRRLDAGADRARLRPSCCATAIARAKCRSRISTSATGRPRACPANSSPRSACRSERRPPTATRCCAAYKVSRRFDQDISAVFVVLPARPRRASGSRGRASAAAASRRHPCARARPKTLLAGRRWDARDRARRRARRSRPNSRRSPTCARRPIIAATMLATLVLRFWRETGADRSGAARRDARVEVARPDARATPR